MSQPDPEANAPLYSPAVVRALLSEYGLRADKAFGQNFLIDGNVLRFIAEAGRIEGHDTVLEVGPGLGVLTRELVARAGRVVSVELDERLLPVLEKTLGNPPNLTVVQGDALQFDFSTLPEGSLLVANLPYNVATPLIVKALESGRFKRLVFLVQREVAQRLSARPGEEAFGALSLIIAYFGRAHSLKEVRPGSFYPPPDVTSSVVRIEVKPGVTPDPQLTGLIHTSFRHRRKTLKKNLLMAGLSADRVEQALGALGVDPRIRAEALDLEQFRQLSQALMRSS
jgi:16S rRNA (adenine1518-N6/adenine1519-N6)-dimethyltransferase